jgi:uncharacterized membrane protein
MKLFIAKFLRYGVVLAGLLMLFGWMSAIDFNGDVFAKFATYDDVRLMTAVSRVYQNRQWGTLTSYAGMAVLISLPFFRVLMTMIVFVKKRDHILAVLSALVLFGLLASLTLGIEL